MKKHFVTFFSPGTFFAEETTKPIDKWNINEAMKMAHSITERYSATPYGFQFSTRERADDELDSKATKKSGMYFLGGKIETIAEVEARDDLSEHILLSNMKCNGWNRIIVNTNSWKCVQPITDADTVLDWAPRKRAKDG